MKFLQVVSIKNNDTEGPAQLAQDGNKNTIWHTEWSYDAIGNQTAYYTFDLKKPTTINGLRYLPRTGGANVNGKIKDYEIVITAQDEVGKSSSTKVEGTFETSGVWQKASFKAIDNVVSVQLKVKSSTGQSAGEVNKYASAAELRLTTKIDDQGGTEIPVDKSELTAYVETVENQLKGLHKEDYTVESWNLLQTKLQEAKNILDNKDATAYDVALAIANLETAFDGLTRVNVPSVDKTALNDLIKRADLIDTTRYTEESVNVFKKALAEAKEINADENATQAQVDTVCDKLLEMIHYLSYTGNSKSLQALVKAAEDINVDVYTEESVKAFRAALEEAVELLKDENALQYELDAAQQKLQEAMEGLTIIPVDKSKLAKAVKEAQKYVEKLNEYTPQSAELFQGALDAAKAVLDDEKATQEQVEHAFVNLQNAIFNLRLIPNKDKLEELLSKAENIDLSLYTEESGNVLKAAIADAKAIFEDENATEKQVAYASDLLAKAMDGLKTAESKEPTDDKKPSAEQGNAQASKENASEKKPTAAKTGDTTMMFVWILVMIAGVSTVTVIYEKKENMNSRMK